MSFYFSNDCILCTLYKPTFYYLLKYKYECFFLISVRGRNDEILDVSNGYNLLEELSTNVPTQLEVIEQCGHVPHV